MENYIIIGMIAVIVVIAVISSIKHFKGEGGCCGGGSYKPKRKKLSGIKYTKKFKVGGMHCEHCKNRVEEAVNDIKGGRRQSRSQKRRADRVLCRGRPR